MKAVTLESMRAQKAKIDDLLERLPEDELGLMEDLTMIRKGLMIWSACIGMSIHAKMEEDDKYGYTD